MKAKSAYILEFSDGAELFSESETGVLDLASRGLSGSDAREVAESLVGPEAAVDEVVVDAEQWEPTIYESEELRPRSFGYTRLRRDGTVDPPPAVTGFFHRYSGLRRLVSHGDFLSAARILSRSRKLSSFIPLVQYLFADSLALILILDLFHRGYDSQSVERLLTGGDDAGAPQQTDREEFVRTRNNGGIDRLMQYCRHAIGAKSAAEFEEESKQAVLGYLSSNQSGIVLPVVGTFARPAARDISDQVRIFIEDARREVLIRGDRAAAERLETYLRSIAVEIRAEPDNPYDPNALAVWVRTPQILYSIDVDAPRHVGYLKREVAALLAPGTAEGLRITAALARLEDGEMEIRLLAES